MMKRTDSVDATACSALYPASDPSHVLFMGLAQGAAVAWKLVLFAVDGALLPVAGAIGYLQSLNRKERRRAMLASLSDRALGDVGIARGSVGLFARLPEEAYEACAGPHFE